ncbi:transporter substrate-binding domain-containing protein [Marinomonas sp. 15G1-11]|uniref:Transporter substrate-binding domain-containing protein n=1 Tax=Marinomonas phaeophyticola TaxID=3004091 RepID=A0ABT4JQ38_9GAMM|nr:transporter substrate-binding domain-containing protein [Marinomonas sp. 15G1-11]MCZ2720345.1 transporter substrate-binding domain-containing protein [Marinomonas sp. 15G1-11]
MLKQQYISKLFLYASLILFSQASLSRTEINFVASPFPPVQYEENAIAKGYVSQLLREIHRNHPELGPLHINFMPWKRAMHEALTHKNTLFFSISRTPDREEKFQWIAEVSPYAQFFYSLKETKTPPINNFQDIADNKYLIGIQSGSNLEALLKYNRTPPELITHTTNYQTSIKMLYAERIDLVPLTYFLAKGAACSLGYDHTLLKKNFEITELARPLWLVANKDTSIKLVNIYKNEISRLKISGWLQEETNNEITLWEEDMCSKQATGKTSSSHN